MINTIIQPDCPTDKEYSITVAFFNRLLIKHSFWINKLGGRLLGVIYFPNTPELPKLWAKVCVLRAVRVVCQWLYWQMLLNVCAFLWGMSHGLLRAARGSRVALSSRWAWLLQEALNLGCPWRSQVPGTQPSPHLHFKRLDLIMLKVFSIFNDSI